MNTTVLQSNKIDLDLVSILLVVTWSKKCNLLIYLDSIIIILIIAEVFLKLMNLNLRSPNI